MLTPPSTEQQQPPLVGWRDGVAGEAVIPKWWKRIPYCNVDDFVVVEGNWIKVAQRRAKRPASVRRSDMDVDDAAWLGAFERIGVEQSTNSAYEGWKPRKRVNSKGGWLESKESEDSLLIGGFDASDSAWGSYSGGVEFDVSEDSGDDRESLLSECASTVPDGQHHSDPPIAQTCAVCGQTIRGRPSGDRRAEARRAYQRRRAGTQQVPNCPACGQPVRGMQLNGNNGEATNLDDVDDEWRLHLNTVFPEPLFFNVLEIATPEPTLHRLCWDYKHVAGCGCDCDAVWADGNVLTLHGLCVVCGGYVTHGQDICNCVLVGRVFHGRHTMCGRVVPACVSCGCTDCRLALELYVTGCPHGAVAVSRPWGHPATTAVAVDTMDVNAFWSSFDDLWELDGPYGQPVRSMQLNGNNGEATNSDDVDRIRKNMANNVVRAAMFIDPDPVSRVADAAVRGAPVVPMEPDRAAELMLERLERGVAREQVRRIRKRSRQQRPKHPRLDLAITAFGVSGIIVSLVTFLMTWARVSYDFTACGASGSGELWLTGIGVFHKGPLSGHTWYVAGSVPEFNGPFATIMYYFSWQWVYWTMSVIGLVLCWRRGFKTFILLSMWVTTFQVWWAFGSPGAWPCGVRRVRVWFAPWLYLSLMSLHMFIAIPNKVRRFGFHFRRAVDPVMELLDVLDQDVRQPVVGWDFGDLGVVPTGREPTAPPANVRDSALNGNNGSATNTDDLASRAGPSSGLNIFGRVRDYGSVNASDGGSESDGSSQATPDDGGVGFESSTATSDTGAVFWGDRLSLFSRFNGERRNGYTEFVKAIGRTGSNAWNAFLAPDDLTWTELIWRPYDRRCAIATSEDFAFGNAGAPVSRDNSVILQLKRINANGIPYYGHAFAYPGGIMTGLHVVRQNGKVLPLQIGRRLYLPSHVDEDQDLAVYGRIAETVVPGSGDKVYAVSSQGVLCGTVHGEGLFSWFDTMLGWSGSPIFTREGAFVGIYSGARDDFYGRPMWQIASGRALENEFLGKCTTVVMGLGTGKSTREVQRIASLPGALPLLLLNPNVATVKSLTDWHMNNSSFTIAARAGHEEKFQVGDPFSSQIVIMTYDAAALRAMGSRFATLFKTLVIDESHEESPWTSLFEDGDLPEWARGFGVVKLTATPPGVAFDPNTRLNKTVTRTQWSGNFDQLPDVTGRRIHFVESKRRVEVVAQLYEEKGLRAFRVTSATKDTEVPRFVAHEGPAVVVATNALRSGITLDLDECVDEGYEYVATMNRDGRETIVRQPTQPWSSMQRFGRVGRFKEGHIFYTTAAGTGPPMYGIDANNAIKTEILRASLAELFGVRLEVSLGGKWKNVRQLILAGVPPVESSKAANDTSVWGIYGINGVSTGLAERDVEPGQLHEQVVGDERYFVPSDDSFFVGDYTRPTHVHRREAGWGPAIVCLALFVYARFARFWSGVVREFNTVPSSKVWELCAPKIDFEALRLVVLVPNADSNLGFIDILRATRSRAASAMEVAGTFVASGVIAALALHTVINQDLLFIAGLVGIVYTAMHPSRQTPWSEAWTEDTMIGLISLGVITTILCVKKFGATKQVTVADRATSRGWKVAMMVVVLTIAAYVWDAKGSPQWVTQYVAFVNVLFNRVDKNVLGGLMNVLAHALHVLVGLVETLERILKGQEVGTRLDDALNNALSVFNESVTLSGALMNPLGWRPWVFSSLLGVATSLASTYSWFFEALKRNAARRSLDKLDNYVNKQQPTRKASSGSFIGWLAGCGLDFLFVLIQNNEQLGIVADAHVIDAKKADASIVMRLRTAGWNMELNAPSPQVLCDIVMTLRYLLSWPAAIVTNYVTASVHGTFAFSTCLFTLTQMSFDDPLYNVVGFAFLLAAGPMITNMGATWFGGVACLLGTFGRFQSDTKASFTGVATRYYEPVADPRALNVLSRSRNYLFNEVTTVFTGVGRTDWTPPSVPANHAEMVVAWAEAFSWTRYLASAGYTHSHDQAIQLVRDFPMPLATGKLHYGESVVPEGHHAVFLLTGATAQQMGKFERVGVLRTLSGSQLFCLGLFYSSARRGGVPRKVLERWSDLPVHSTRRSFDFYYAGNLEPAAVRERWYKQFACHTSRWRATMLNSLWPLVEALGDSETMGVFEWVAEQFADSITRTEVFMELLHRRAGGLTPMDFEFETGLFKVLGKVQMLRPGKKRTHTVYSRLVERFMSGLPMQAAARSYLGSLDFWNGFVLRFVRPLKARGVWPAGMRRAIVRFKKRLVRREPVGPPYTRYNRKTGPGILTEPAFPGAASKWADDDRFWTAGLAPLAGREAFAKNEKLVKPEGLNDRRKFLPRAIVNLSGPARYMNHLADPYTVQIYELPVSGIGWDPFKMARWLGRCSEKGWSFLSVDTKKWDASQWIATKLIWFEYLKHMSSGNRLCARLCADSLWTPTVLDNGFVVAAMAPTQSGDYDTSASNTAINTTLLNCAVYEATGEDTLASDLCESRAVGDDIVLAAPPWLLKRCFTSIHDTYSQMGLELDEASWVIHNTCQRVRFCSHGAGRAGDTYVPLRSSDVVFARLHVSQKDEIAGLIDSATGYFVLYYHTPHVREFCRAILTGRRLRWTPELVKRLSGYVDFGDGGPTTIDALEAAAIRLSGTADDICDEDLRAAGYDWDYKPRVAQLLEALG